MAARKKTASKAAKAPQKAAGGRPTKYRPAYAEQARKLALLGQTDAQIADFFNIGEATLHRWKREHDGFRQSICAGKVRADADVAASLYQTALGGGTVTELREEPGDAGQIVTKRTVRELPPDVRAQRFWLNNRQPALWRDKVVLADETPPEVLAETANRYAELMQRARDRQRALLIERGIEHDGET